MLYMGVSENSRFSPQIIHLNRVFQYINHPFWGTSIFGNTHIFVYSQNINISLGIPSPSGISEVIGRANRSSSENMTGFLGYVYIHNIHIHQSNIAVRMPSQFNKIPLKQWRLQHQMFSQFLQCPKNHWTLL